MTAKFDEAWLERAIKLEDEANCDIEAGLDLGQYLGQYIAKTQSYVSREKLMSVLQEELGTILSREDLEIIADATQNYISKHIKEKYHSSEIAS